MREIKFRGWYTNPLHSYMVSPEFHGPINEIFNDPDRKGRVVYMQYTGLKDKNGVEIFEGDVIKFTNGIDEVYEKVGTVIFDLDECGYKAQYTENGRTHCIYLINPTVFADKYNEITYEIIGNIYENPELLEVQA